MLEGIVPFPPEFARRYRERGYWTDKSLAEEFRAVFERYADRVALILCRLLGHDRAHGYAEKKASQQQRLEHDNALPTPIRASYRQSMHVVAFGVQHAEPVSFRLTFAAERRF